MNTTLQTSYDVLVIGGGPAGSTVAALTAQAGHSTLLVERSSFPRFHVGESLIPETYWTLKRLGLIEKLSASAFPKKYSVQFFSEGMKPSAPFYFDEYKDCASSQTWQVWRDEFDQMMLELVTANGGTVRTETQVLDVLFDGDTATGARIRERSDEGTSDREIAAQVVVDATGQSTFLASRLGLKATDPALRKGSIWTYFENAHRDPGRDEGATLIMQTEGKKSWFWSIPLPGNITSIGCTGSMEYLFPKGESAAAIFERELDRCPAMKDRLTEASRVRDYLATKDYSYYSRQGAGNGWLLVGDAFGFIDPVYSSGVYLALKSGELAADAVHAALEADDLSADRLGAWQADYREGLMLFRKLVYAFYDPDFSFGRFLKAHPQYRENVTDILIGDVFKPGVGDIFDAMGQAIPSTDWDEPQSARVTMP